MRYSEKVYKQVFPTVKEVPTVESAVETFKPTEETVSQEEDKAVEIPTADVEEETGGEDGDDTDINGID